MVRGRGLAQVTIGLPCPVALVRYRAMVPLVHSLLLPDELGRNRIFFVMPVARTKDAPGFCINLALGALHADAWAG